MKKKIVLEIADQCVAFFKSKKIEKASAWLLKELLSGKVRFPYLEFAAKHIFIHLPSSKAISFLDVVMEKKTIGGNVIAGIILQLRLEKYFEKSLAKACEYIIAGDEWYVCDIIGERVIGFALLHHSEKTISILKKYCKNESKWIRRVVGVAGHYAVKNGLKKKYVEELFAILLSQSHVTEFHTKTGIGWAAKTISKFHPDIVSKFDKRISSDEKIRPWFKRKMRIGLSRKEKYAGRYSD